MSKEILEKAKKFDLFIAPHELKDFKILDPEKAEELFTIGYNATKEKLNDIDIERIMRD
jgi:predicted acylesterase/phospholipase RssA